MNTQGPLYGKPARDQHYQQRKKTTVTMPCSLYDVQPFHVQLDSQRRVGWVRSATPPELLFRRLRVPIALRHSPTSSGAAPRRAATATAGRRTAAVPARPEAAVLFYLPAPPPRSRPSQKYPCPYRPYLSASRTAFT